MQGYSINGNPLGLVDGGGPLEYEHAAAWRGAAMSAQ
jgi:hypothetical protein